MSHVEKIEPCGEDVRQGHNTTATCSSLIGADSCSGTACLWSEHLHLRTSMLKLSLNPMDFEHRSCSGLIVNILNTPKLQKVKVKHKSASTLKKKGNVLSMQILALKTQLKSNVLLCQLTKIVHIVNKSHTNSEYCRIGKLTRKSKDDQTAQDMLRSSTNC